MNAPKSPDKTFDIEDNRPLYTLGVASQLSEIPAHSIRQYIDMGLLIPFKLESKQHLFSQTDVRRLKIIQELIHERGLNFAGLRTMMAMHWLKMDIFTATIISRRSSSSMMPVK